MFIITCLQFHISTLYCVPSPVFVQPICNFYFQVLANFMLYETQGCKHAMLWALLAQFRVL